MIVVLVFVSGCVFGACVTGLLMLGPRKRKLPVDLDVDCNLWGSDIAPRSGWDFPSPPCEPLVLDDPDRRTGSLR